MPWIFNEDAALKEKLQGLRVDSTNAPQGSPVAVRFRLPETELADLSYPCLIIEHAGIFKDDSREHRGYISLPYAPEGSPLWSDPALTTGSLDPALSPYKAQFPIPYNLDYVVTLYARKAQHHISLVGALAAIDRLPARFGYLEIPQDGTVRNLEIIGGPDLTSGKDDDGKRLFSATYRVRVSTELAASDIEVFAKVTEIDHTIEDMDTSALLASFRTTYAP